MGFLYFPKKPQDLNVLLISVDGLRPGHLGCYGYKRGDTSPNIDKLAKEGVLFTQAIAQASWTPPSVASIITSAYPSSHKIYRWNSTLDQNLPTMAEILKNYGYHTFLCSGHNNTLFEILGLQRGFDGWTINKEFFIDCKRVNESALNFLNEAANKKRKFFLWTHYMDTHDMSIGFPQEKHHIENITKDEIESYILKYDEAISSIDNQIGILFNELKALGLYKNIIIIISADHGQEICEHDLCFSHGILLRDSLIRVPLIISCTNLLQRNKTISRQVQHIDIAPTVCNLLNIKKPKSFEGESLLPLIKRNRQHPIYAFSEHKEHKHESDTESWLYSKFSIRSLQWKLIYTYYPNANEYQLYDLKKDPGELTNLVDIEKKQFKLLNAELEKWMNRPRPDIKTLIKPLDEETRNKLRSLGYLQ